MEVPNFAHLFRSVTFFICFSLAYVLLGAGCSSAGHGPYPDLVPGEALFKENHLEKVAEFASPPGNIAVSATGRVFITFHPGGKPEDLKLAEIVDGQAVPFPNSDYQDYDYYRPSFQTVLALRIDAKNRLWSLDYGAYGSGRVRLMIFDIDKRRLVQERIFNATEAGFGSMYNDLQIDGESRYAYISDTSPLAKNPALVVYDSQSGQARRLLTGHPSVADGDFEIYVHGKALRALGLVRLNFGVDSVALDRQGRWLYYASLNGGQLYRIRTDDLKNESLESEELGARVQKLGAIPLSDGISIDEKDRVYISDFAHSAIVRRDPDGQLQTLVQSPKLRWPDGLGFGPDGYLYFTCSDLGETLFATRYQVLAMGPFQVWRLKISDVHPAAGQ